ncbi:MAG: hypothetical protein WBN85_02770 [Candidatus Macondimonas sp.]
MMMVSVVKRGPKPAVEHKLRPIAPQGLGEDSGIDLKAMRPIEPGKMPASVKKTGGNAPHAQIQ